MKNYRKSDYALNKFSEGIVYQFSDRTLEISLEDFLRDNPGKTEADFMALKAVSDEIYLEQARLETAQGNKTFSMTGLEDATAHPAPSLDDSYIIYAWKLVATDKTPAGKRDDISLREKEKEINRDIADGIDTVGKKMTVCQLYAKQNSQRADVKRGTKKQREYLMGLLRDDPLGGKSIDAVKPSDAKEWAIRMREKGFSFQSISNYKRSLRAAFFIAIEDDCVRKNPFSFALNKVLEDDRGEKTVLTPEQEVSLIDFAQNDPVYQKYADELIILLGTGLRISEFCGLTTNLDFRNRLIRVDHQLLRDSKESGRPLLLLPYYVSAQSHAGIRRDMRITLPNGKWRKRLKIKALPPFAELHKVRAGNCKMFP